MSTIAILWLVIGGLTSLLILHAAMEWNAFRERQQARAENERCRRHLARLVAEATWDSNFWPDTEEVG